MGFCTCGNMPANEINTSEDNLCLIKGDVVILTSDKVDKFWLPEGLSQACETLTRIIREQIGKCWSRDTQATCLHE